MTSGNKINHPTDNAGLPYPSYILKKMTKKNWAQVFPLVHYSFYKNEITNKTSQAHFKYFSP